MIVTLHDVVVMSGTVTMRVRKLQGKWRGRMEIQFYASVIWLSPGDVLNLTPYLFLCIYIPFCLRSPPRILFMRLVLFE